MSDVSTDWYWDLTKGIAVTAAERGPGDHMLGPYRTKGEAQNWKGTIEARNDTWDAADERWDNWERSDQRSDD